MYSVRYSCQVSIKFEFSEKDFRKIPQISNFVKIFSLEAELFHADGRTDGQTDMSKQIVAFCNFANALKTVS
jgi:hypothetical protein